MLLTRVSVFARGLGGRLKFKTRLLSGREPSPSVVRVQATTFRQWAETYLQLEEVRRLGTYKDRKLKVENLVEFFSDRTLLSISPEDVSDYRAQRVQHKRIPFTQCNTV
jgi:hypothetical protein